LNLKSLTLVAAGIVMPFICSAQQTAAEECPADAPTSYSRPKAETANIEEVLATEKDGYRASEYVIRWHGARVLLTDTLARSRLGLGESVSFIASHHDIDG
jgi:hypothetical protein